MKKFDVVILAGGFGSRIRSVVKDVPKPLAIVGDKPFLLYMLEKIYCYKPRKIIVSVYYKFEKIVEFLGNSYNEIPIKYAIEDEPLDTGGALKYSLSFCKSDNVLAYNADTYFDIDINDFYRFHIEKKSCFTIALKNVENVERYNVVKIDKEQRVIDFFKKSSGNGLINGGFYFIKRDFLKQIDKKVFSLENDILRKKDLKIFAKPYNSYFIDIGLPETYMKIKDKFRIKKSKNCFDI